MQRTTLFVTADEWDRVCPVDLYDEFTATLHSYDGGDACDLISVDADSKGNLDSESNPGPVAPEDVLTQLVADNGEDEMAEALAEWANCAEARVTDDGKCWIAKPQTGNWLDATRAAAFVAWVTSR